MIFRKKLPTALKADLDSFIQIAYEPTPEAFVTEDAVFGGAALTPKARAIGKAKYSEERAVYRETAAPPPYAAPMQAAAPQSLSVRSGIWTRAFRKCCCERSTKRV